MRIPMKAVRYDVAADEVLYAPMGLHLILRAAHAAKVRLLYVWPRAMGWKLPWMVR